MINLHRWLDKGKKWERYGSYIYREDTCACGCVRRVVIDDEGYERIESYTVDGNTTVKHVPCTRERKKGKGRKGRKKRGSNLLDDVEQVKVKKEKKEKKIEIEEEDFLIINMPT